MPLISLLLCLQTLAAPPAVVLRADLILKGGTVYLEREPDAPAGTDTAQAVALRGSDVALIGTNDAVLAAKDESTRIVDLKGRTVIAGFHDSFLDLRAVKTEWGETLGNTLLKMQESAAAAGITSVSGPAAQDVLETIAKLARDGKLTLRYELWGDIEKTSDFITLRERHSSLPRDSVKLSGVFGVLDGNIEDRTAALLEPYSDAPSVQGLPRYTQENLNAMVLEANRRGLSVILKASGDRAVNMAISAFGLARKTLFNSRFRNRIVGADIIAPSSRGRLADLGIAVIGEPDVLLPHGGSKGVQRFVRDKLGMKRMHLAYPWKSLSRAGTLLTFGSTWPERELNPLQSIYAAVARPGILVGEESLSVAEAIAAFTINPAIASREEHVKGTLREGKFADLVVLSRDPFKVRSGDMRTIKVDMTVVGGRVVHENLVGPGPAMSGAKKTGF